MKNNMLADKIGYSLSPAKPLWEAAQQWATGAQTWLAGLISDTATVMGDTVLNSVWLYSLSTQGLAIALAPLCIDRIF